MLSQASKEEILRKLESKTGHPVSEEGLSPGNRRAIANLAEIQRNLFAISEVLNGEQGRVQRSAELPSWNFRSTHLTPKPSAQ